MDQATSEGDLIKYPTWQPTNRKLKRTRKNDSFENIYTLDAINKNQKREEKEKVNQISKEPNVPEKEQSTDFITDVPISKKIIEATDYGRPPDVEKISRVGKDSSREASDNSELPPNHTTDMGRRIKGEIGNKISLINEATMNKMIEDNEEDEYKNYETTFEDEMEKNASSNNHKAMLGNKTHEMIDMNNCDPEDADMILSTTNSEALNIEPT
ncbi:hypothetical protein HAX54_030875 [Datura stramonium]|uniref:Uncharacterized protein n=1 Tax=Datura stramonium TaxID=4076 RepID=A0ABS8SBJ5_DATST|nr:hypothetical protein [Datura stramonium]